MRYLATSSAVIGLALGLSLGACGGRVSTSARSPGASPTTAPVPPAGPRPTAPAPTHCTSRAGLPDARCTPGATNPSVTSATIRTTVCKRGWTSTIRPPIAYTAAQKRKGIRAYGYADMSPADYEEDHLIPLELGGSATDPRNLWPEPRHGALAKDHVENALNHAVCSGRLSLARAQREIAANWETAR